MIKPFQIMLNCYFPELWYLGSEIWILFFTK